MGRTMGLPGMGGVQGIIVATIPIEPGRESL